jgi:hypothetical protein
MTGARHLQIARTSPPVRGSLINEVELENVMELTDWMPVPGAEYCSMRCLVGTDPANVANRVAFIEKTPRVRVAPFTNERDDWKNWEQGPKGCAPEYGAHQPSRDWCDRRLTELSSNVEVSGLRGCLRSSA